MGNRLNVIWPAAVSISTANSAGEADSSGQERRIYPLMPSVRHAWIGTFMSYYCPIQFSGTTYVAKYASVRWPITGCVQIGLVFLQSRSVREKQFALAV